ncbi:sugar phosphate isomerase/epimerase family protein [Tunicatimonas pelagia]|uniref:sugar phosphate isomerase/epimerase family protein n=1 Tax=Tunicatimonas pelagia TaxID=931531 RepID=UPI00266638BD|nr:sugar phosphate isomerase/epimerase [Tunicatimonas pelagia]WKN43838.1 sugar phosphate isomerase/epimerase [Tunicatimonas pelagia]
MQEFTTRRDFLKQASFLAATSVLPINSVFHTTDGFIDQLGLQLYTVRDVLVEKPQETMQAIRNAGYQQVELFDGQLLPQLHSVLKSLGIAINSTHFLSPLLTGNWELLEATGVRRPPANYTLQVAIDQAAEYEVSYFIFPFLYPGERGGIDAYKTLAEQLNQTGELCKKVGIQLGYHNHSFELQPMDGSSPMEVLMSETDPALVCFELDVFWVSVAGHNPAEYIRKYANRIELLHLKDKKENAPQTYRAITMPPESFQPVGSGVLNFTEILQAAQEAQIKHVFVEQDASDNPLGDIKKSSEYLRSLK